MENEIAILIVEDEALIAQNIKLQLEDFGYTISAVCYNYNAAVRAITEKAYDVLITDINLGNGIDEKSGLQIAQLVKQSKNCPIIFLTAFGDKDTIKKAAALSPSAYLVKPINAASLFAAVQLAVENFSNKVESLEENTKLPDYLFVKQGSKLIKVFWKDVYHLEAIKNYVKIKTTLHTSVFLVRGSLQQVMQVMIPLALQNRFVKINRAEAIEKTSITKVDKDNVETAYGKFKLSNEFDKKYL